MLAQPSPGSPSVRLPIAAHKNAPTVMAGALWAIVGTLEDSLHLAS